MKIKINKKLTIIIASNLVIILVALLAIFLSYNAKESKLAESFTLHPYVQNSDTDRIYFLNVGHSDAILLQSQGRFAMVDAGEDTDNPRNLPNLIFDGYEDDVVSFLKKVAGNEKGKVHLDFIVGTHSHSDHIGGFDTIILDEDITVGRAYIKEYREEFIRDYEIINWDNQEVYDQMIEACIAKGVEIIQDTETLNAGTRLGNMRIDFYNTGYLEKKNLGENENSICTLVTVSGRKILLMGDQNNLLKGEKELANTVGKIDVIKVGHHGLKYSSTNGFIKKINPSIGIVTSKKKGMYKRVRLTLTHHDVATYSTIDENGVVVEIGDIGLILFSDFSLAD